MTGKSLVITATVIAGILASACSSETSGQDNNEEVPAAVTSLTSADNSSPEPDISSESEAAELPEPEPEEIILRDISDAVITLAKSEFAYTGNKIVLTEDGAPFYTVTVDGIPLNEADFTVDCENNTEPGFEAPGAVFSGQGNFTGEKKVFFSILPPAVRSVNMSSKDKGISVSWNSAAGADGYELLISPDKEFSGNVVTVSTDECAASLTNGFTLGTEYHCKVRAYILKGDAGDRLYGDFSEVCSTKVYGGISKVTVSEDYYVYDGNPHSPKAAVYDNDGSLLNEGRDYTLKMPQETVPGRYAVTAEGINSYHGQATAFYDILPVCNKITSLESTDNNIIVSWEKDALADGYMIIYSQSADFNSYHTFTQGNTDKTSANLVTYPKAGQTWYVKVCSFIYTDASHTGWRGFYSQPQSIEVKGTVRTVSEPEVKKPPAGQDTPPLQAGSMQDLKTSLENMVAGYDGSWSVYVKNLRTDESFVVNDKSYYAASLMKLFCMTATYQKIEEGKLKESADVNTLLKDMITVSSNSAFNQLLVNKIGTTAVREWINANGYTNTYQCHGYSSGPYFKQTVLNNGYNTTTVYDCGKLLESIYRGECVSEAASEKMLGLLKGQTVTIKIPYVIPKNVVVANKTGEVSSNNHDCAIVFLDNNPYILCVMSENKGNAMGYTWCIRNISKKVYDFMVSYE